MGNSISPQKPDYNAVWSWQSNPNPWSKTEPQTWTEYSPDLTKLIEEAYAQKNVIFEFEERQIIFKKMIQRRKTEHSRQRPIKRVTNSTVDPISLRKKRFFGEVPNPKTVSESFGSLDDFIDFLKKRSKVLEDIYCKKLPGGIFPEKIINDEIYPLIFDSIMKEAKAKRKVPEAQNLVQESKTFDCQDDLWKFLIFIYTKETFLYKRVNKLLREEDWNGLNNLLPYVFFLSVALSDFGNFKNWSERSGGGFTIPGCLYKSNSATNDTHIYLYRGTSMQTHLLEFYNPKKTQYFSWPAFTSTTKSKKAAEFFSKMGTTSEGVSPVFFTIEATLNFTTMNNTWLLDASKYSEFSREEEVILPPGTVYEITRYQKVGNLYYIDLKIAQNLEKLSNEGSILKGRGSNTIQDLENVINIQDKDIVLSHITDHEVEKAIDLLVQGKNFIENINILKLYLSAEHRIKLMNALSTFKSLKTLLINKVPFSIEPGKMFANAQPEKSPLKFVQNLVKIQITPRKITVDLNMKKLDQSYILELGNLILDSGAEELEFRQIFISSGTEAIAPYLPLTKIKSLLIECSYLHSVSDLNLEEFEKIFPKTCIESLTLHGTFASKKNIAHLCHIIKQSNLKKLHLNCEDTWPLEHFQKLGTSLVGSSITYLKLSCQVRSCIQSIDELFTFLPQTDVKTLILLIPISLSSITKLIELLSQTEISYLYFGQEGNEFTSEQTKIIQLLKQTLSKTKIRNFGVAPLFFSQEYQNELSELLKSHGIKDLNGAFKTKYSNA